MSNNQSNPFKNDIYDDFMAKTNVDRLQKILARYELFRKVLTVPGDIVECGVYKGSGLYTFAKLQKLFRPNSEQRIVGFDFFNTERPQEAKYQEDLELIHWHDNSCSSIEEIKKNCTRMGVSRLELVAGDIVKTTRQYVEDNLGFRISLLYIDVDNYEGTLAILENFYDLVTSGGIISFDEYALRTYGESNAVDEFMKGRPEKLQCLPWANTPSGFIIKQ